jgi:hypothetical protein
MRTTCYVIFHFCLYCLYCELKSSLRILYDISCISGILYRNIFKWGLSICWTNCQDSMKSVAPFLVDPPGLCSIATWDCGILWRMIASHLKMFPFFYTASLLKLLWQMKYVVSCRSSKECPKSFLFSSYSMFSTNKSTALAFYLNVWCPWSAILSITSSISFVISFQVQENKKEIWFWNLLYDPQHNFFLNIIVFIVIILPLYKLG